RAPHENKGPAYSCQADGMIGLGPGARSYTRTLHYSSEYAVSAQGVKSIIKGYVDRDPASFDLAAYGFELDGEDERRRFAILSLLAEGINLAEYRARFGTDAFDDLPDLGALEPQALAQRIGGRLTLT